MRLGLPEANAAEKSVSIVSRFDSLWQSIEFLCASTSENDVIGNQRFLQHHHGTKDFAFPSFFAEFFQSRFAKLIFDNVVVAIRQITELEWEHVVFPDQGRTQSGAQSKKQHSPALITAERLHRGVIDNSDRFA